eukprot:scpid56675/ scgid4703/ 
MPSAGKLARLACVLCVIVLCSSVVEVDAATQPPATAVDVTVVGDKSELVGHHRAAVKEIWKSYLDPEVSIHFLPSPAAGDGDNESAGGKAARAEAKRRMYYALRFIRKWRSLSRRGDAADAWEGGDKEQENHRNRYRRGSKDDGGIFAQYWPGKEGPGVLHHGTDGNAQDKLGDSSFTGTCVLVVYGMVCRSVRMHPR